MELYRGDCFFNEITTPGRYRFDGLHAKSFGKGNPAYIAKNSIHEAVRQHISHPNPTERDYYNVTDFISFSMDRDRALYWGTDMATKAIIPCAKPYTETRYIFTLNIPDHEMERLADGLYSFSFFCIPSVRQANAPSDLATALCAVHSCPRCEAGKPHRIVLIDTVEFLKAHVGAKMVKDALALAMQDREWLILPSDPLDHNGRSSTVQRAAFWLAEIFSVSGESRDPMEYGPIGIIE